MKHTIKHHNGAPLRTLGATKPRMIGLRLPEQEAEQLAQMAKEDDRSISQFARICLRLGIEEYQARKAALVED